MFVALSLPFMAACEDDNDSNPTFHEPGDNAFVLNVPAYAENNVYDLENTDTVRLTTSQPDYGFTAGTTYTVQMSLDGTFADDASNYVVLPTAYNNTSIGILGAEFSNSVNELWQLVKGDEDQPEQIDLYVRLKANLTANADLGVCYSNAVKLTVKPYTPPVTVSLPATMYLIGAMPASNWSTWLPLHPVYDVPGKFYGVFYFSDGCNFKFGPDEGVWDTARTWGQYTADDQAGAGLGEGTDSGNSQIEKGGWYTVVVTTVIKNDEVLYTMSVLPAEIYVFGAANGGTWDFADAWKFAVPTTADGDFVSPALTAAGEVRIAVKTGTEWWRTELTFLQGTGELYYRNENIIDSWGGDLGADYSIPGTAGVSVHLNFATGTGSLR